MGFSNASLGYLNYPTQVIFKCCKLIPVMIGGILVQQKVYKAIDIVAASCMCAGLILFTLADNKVSPDFNLIGKLYFYFIIFCTEILINKLCFLYFRYNFDKFCVILWCTYRKFSRKNDEKT